MAKQEYEQVRENLYAMKDGAAALSEFCIILEEGSFMKTWVCTVCGWIYDEEKGDPDYDLAAGVAFEDLPEDFVCPLCGVGKDMFEEQA